MPQCSGNIVKPPIIHCRDRKAEQWLGAEGFADRLFRLAFSLASDAPSPGSRRNTSRAGQRLRAEGVVDHLFHLAFDFASDMPSPGSGRNETSYAPHPPGLRRRLRHAVARLQTEHLQRRTAAKNWGGSRTPLLPNLRLRLQHIIVVNPDSH